MDGVADFTTMGKYLISLNGCLKTVKKAYSMLRVFYHNLKNKSKLFVVS